MKTDYSTKSQEELIKKSIQGDSFAQRELFRKLYRAVRQICLRYTRCEEDAKDALQDTFVTVFLKIPEYRGEGSFEGWVKRIAVNRCLKSFKPSRHLCLEELSEHVLVSDEVTDIVNTNEINKQIERLPQGCKTVFNLYAVEGYSHKEIGELLEISEGTSKSQYAYAKKILQTRLGIPGRFSSEFAA